MRYETSGSPRSAAIRAISPGTQASMRKLADTATTSVWMTDANGRWTFLSPAIRAMFRGADPIYLSDWLAFVHPDDRELVLNALDVVKMARGEFYCEHRIVRSDGTVRWVLGIAAPRFAGDGSFSGYSGVTIDITAKHQAFARLAASEANYRLLAHKSSDLICHCDAGGAYTCVSQEREARGAGRASEERFRSLTDLSSDGYWETDVGGRLTFVSGGLLRVLGVEPRQLVGRRRDEFALDPADPDLAAYRRAMSARERFRNLCFASRLPGHDRVVYTSLSGEPKYEHGTFIGFRGVGRDVTSEREMQQRLAQLADANRALIQNSPDSLMVFDGGGRIRRAEGAVREMLGYEPAELIGRHYLDFVVPEMRDEARQAVKRLHERNPLPAYETCWKRKDGGVVRLSWAVRRSDEQPDLVYATARDVTEVHRARSELDRVNERLRATLESVGDAFFSVDKNWRLTYINLKTARFVGRDRDAMLGKLIWEAVPEILGSSVFPHYERAMQSGTSVSVECFYEPSRAWVEARAFPHEEGMSVYFHDISERYETERLVRERERRLRDMIALTPAGYVETDASGVVRDVNPALCAMSGYAREELVGADILSVIAACPVGGLLKTKGGPVRAHGKEIVLRHKLGHELHLLANLTVERDAGGNALSLMAFVTDITERKKAADHLEYLATHDVLTGLPNRLLIKRHLQQLLHGGPPEETVAVMFVDLDRFKRINDSMGHLAGDLLLQRAALRLAGAVHPEDMLARFGGDEFIVAMRCPGGRATAAAQATLLQEALGKAFEVDGQEVFISASIGIAMLEANACTKDVLYQNANTALCRAKAAGRRQHRFFEAAMAAEAKERMALEGALRQALGRGELEVHYQPQVDLGSGRIVGVEALLRWQHPLWGRISPARFIPVAEESGMIVEIGSWVMRTACRQAAAWRAAGLGDLRIAVNLSARQFARPGLVQAVAAVLKETGLPAEQLDIELTESMVMSDLDRTIEVLGRLKELGIKLSVDDFGTGYSSLAYLKRFPIDMLKIDRSFVQEISHDSSDAAIPDAIIAMAHSLGIRVIAEGVETEVQCEVLSRQACDEIQGFLFSQALAAIDVERLIRSGRSLPDHLVRHAV